MPTPPRADSPARDDPTPPATADLQAASAEGDEQPARTDGDVQGASRDGDVRADLVAGARDDTRVEAVWRTAVRPRWVGLLAVAVVVAGVMVEMGVWQLHVYQSKTAEATAARAAQPAVPLDSLMSIDEGLAGKAVGRQVSVSGRWAAAADQVFVADRVDGGRTGYWVVTPLLVSPSSGVLVVRGWVPTPSASAPAPVGEASVTGTIVASEAQDSSAAAAQGRVLPSLRIPTIVGMVDYRLYDAFVVLSSSTPPSGTAVAVQPPPPPTDHAGLRNIAYAVQWWIFAAFVLFMWCRMVVDARRSAASEPSRAAG